MFLRVLVSLLVAAGLSSPAFAKWHVAESDHFVIYANQSASDVEKFAGRLERFHAAMSFTFGKTSQKPSPSSRVNVYVVSGGSKVRKLAGGKNRQIAGFYIPRAGNTIAVVPKLKRSSGKFSMSGETVLLHEYAHHYMYQITNFSWPRWFGEGFAEFYGSAKFFGDGAVGLGAPANHRVMELTYSESVPMHMLVDTDRYLKNKSKRHDEFYGRSWLLYHYLTFNAERREQFAKYKKLLTGGTGELDAAQQSFGDLSVLDRELDSYRKRKKLNYIHLKPERLKIGAINVRLLSAGEAAVMPLQMQSKRGVDDEKAAELLPQIQAVAAKYPNDPKVLSILAEAEYDAGNDDAAINAADRALAIDPATVNAYVQKGFALARKASDAEDDESAAPLWKQTRTTFVALNRLENDHPLPLIWFYRTYNDQGKEPTKLAIKGLERALELAPFDQGLRMMVVNQQVQDERLTQAVKTLRPLANNPHESGLTKAAGKMMDLLKAEQATREKGSGTEAENSTVIIPAPS